MDSSVKEIYSEAVIDWPNIDTVLLDMDGTILDLSFDNYFWLEYMPKIYANENGLSVEESKKFLAESYGAYKGTLEWYCLDFWSEKLGFDIPELKLQLKDKVAFRPGAVEFLSFLAESEKKVYLATNAHPKTLEIKLLSTEFSRYFDALTSSHDFGYPKEEQNYWHALKEKYPFDSSRTLFIDDSVTILESARTFGIKHVYGIARPDLCRPEVNSDPFPAIYDFLKVIQNDD